MRILVTGEGIGPSTGGGRTGILGICKGLARRGHQVVLYATNRDGSDTLDVPLGVPIIEEGVEIYFYPARRTILGYVLSRPMIRALKRGVVRSDVVLIHSLYRFTSTVAAHYCRRFKMPYVLRPHGTLDPVVVYRRHWFLKWLYINLFEKRNFNHAAAIQYSSQMEQEMTREFMTVSSPSLIISEGIDLKDFENLPPRELFRAKYPQTSGKAMILFLGRFHPKKGIELLIQACALANIDRDRTHLVLAGSGDNDYVHHVAAKVRAAGLSHWVTLTGQLSAQDKLSALASADVFVLPSYGENFGLAVVEAMACGVPVLISDNVGIWREIADAGAGVVVPCDAERIAKAIEQLVTDPALRATLGHSGRRLASAQFSMDQMAERMELTYQRLCKIV